MFILKDKTDDRMIKEFLLYKNIKEKLKKATALPYSKRCKPTHKTNAFEPN